MCIDSRARDDKYRTFEPATGLPIFPIPVAMGLHLLVAMATEMQPVVKTMAQPMYDMAISAFTAPTDFIWLAMKNPIAGKADGKKENISVCD